ncbi:MAG TPA: 3-hydroxyacyl-CoA dehydrogenase NAD-binding domain-containing protein [Solirubrobacteraceae bacterium]|jgi:3-hydroxybutyryl-CoA dehydrogenase|nr:3-hydroxyacyl-CoA dehydrogenase NAD-binding domain-containing protein [Solirubrobacteraceae bacterium]
MAEASAADQQHADGEPARTIGVLGAGTMGAGIAQLACKSGAETLLFDPIPEALEKGRERVHDGLRREAAKGKLTAEQAQAAAERLQTVGELEALADCELVIEAVPERIELKHEIYGRLSEIVGESCVLATNTSSLPVTAIAAGAAHPERVVGMHFFNPAPVMALLEVIAGVRSSDTALRLARATGRAMGKTVIDATDGPGFLVNRCNRPFGLEALRMLSERIADIETIDRIVRMEGGFRMGPFELMDLVGVDTGLEVSKSFYELSFGEPRWRPSPISARYAAAGMHGRKSGVGYYDYTSGSHRLEDPPVPDAPEGAGEGVLVISGEGTLAGELRDAARQAGYEVRGPHQPSGGVLPSLIVECDREPAEEDALGSTAEAADRGAARMILCAHGSLSALDPAGSAVGFHVLPSFADAKLVELTRSETSSPLAAERAERLVASLGKHVAWVGDAPGLVLGRIVCQVINESAFAFGEGVGEAADIDTGMLLGLSHPRGPLEWADAIGLDHVLSVLLALSREYREERYRPAPTLRALVAAGRTGRASGSGFFEYPA